MEPVTRFELVTYRLQGDCSTNWATLARQQNINYFVVLAFLVVSNNLAMFDFFLDPFFFLIRPIFVHLSITLYTLAKSSNVTLSHFSIDFLNFLIAIFILSLNSEFLWRNFSDLLTAFFADDVIGIQIMSNS